MMSEFEQNPITETTEEEEILTETTEEEEILAEGNVEEGNEAEGNIGEETLENDEVTIDTEQQIEDEETEQDQRERIPGIVKWFNNAKGFGFIQRNGMDEDIFVHFSQIKGDGYKSLNEGQNVEFSLEKSQKGLRAEDVRAV